MTMKRHLGLAGKSLAGAGLTGIVLYVVGTATQRSWPYWPYGMFGGMILIGGFVFLLGQSRSVARAGEDNVEDTDPIAEPQSRMTPHEITNWSEFLIEVIMLRARSIYLPDAVGGMPFEPETYRRSKGDPPPVYNSYYSSANRTLARGLAADIHRVRRLVRRNDIRRQLASAKSIADKLVDSFNNSEVVRRWGRTSAKDLSTLGEIAEKLMRELMDIPINVSGFDMGRLTLPIQEALNGIIWSDDTMWPAEYFALIQRNSQPLRAGVYQIVFDSLR